MRPTSTSLLTLVAAAGLALASVATVSPAMASDAAASEPAAASVTEAPKPPSVTVLKVGKDEIVENLIVSGSFAAREEILVNPLIEGAVVTEILAEEGDTVKRGQVLVQLSRSTLEIMLEQNLASIGRADAGIAQAQAQIAEAQATLTEARNALDRTQSLRSRGVSTAEQLDQRQAAAKSAQARLTSAQQALAIAQAEKRTNEALQNDTELKLSRTQVKATADGIINRRSVKIGGIASAQGDAMFRIIENGDIDLVADVTDSDLPRLSVGQGVRVTVAGAREPMEGKVRLISREVDNVTRLGRVYIALPSNSNIAIGSSGRGMVEIARSTNVTLPFSAMSFTDGKAQVQVVKDGKIESRTVTTGIEGDLSIEIVEGLAEGETVVTRAGTFLRDGDAITPVMPN
jgi:HlyD family secretion protein